VKGSARALKAAILLTGLAAGRAQAIEIRTIDVRYEKGHYRVQFVADLAAEPQAIERVLTDYAHYPALDARIEESRLIETPPAALPRLYTRLKGCVGWIFCRSMVRVETLQQNPGELIATAIPDLSDVKDSVASTRWQASPSGTHVTYTLNFDPKFWVPALFGRRAMLDTMRQGTLAMFTSVERVARTLPVDNDGR
jgi:hypothetical protein